MTNFYNYLNEQSKFIYKNKKYKIAVLFNEEENHTFESRLERANLSLFEFRDKINSLIEKLQDKEFGLYGVKFNDFGVIVRYKKKQLYVITILSKEMIIKDVDFKILIKEWLEKINNTKIKLNEFRIFNIGDKEIFVENKENDLHIYGKNFYILEE